MNSIASSFMKAAVIAASGVKTTIKIEMEIIIEAGLDSTLNHLASFIDYCNLSIILILIIPSLVVDR